MFNIQGYVIQAEIFQGANSSVYRALRQSDNQPVILKRLKENDVIPAELIRYQQEYDIIRSLSQVAGVIGVYELEKHQNMPVLVLEDFGGESLKHLYTTQPLELAIFLPLAVQLAHIVAEIHAANIIHKDLNPSNFIFNPKTGQLKLIDFGIATRLPRENPILKNPDNLEGTLPYLSPEQTGRMNRSVDYRTDLYSLGVTLYELLTGHLPFETTDAMELVHCHLAKQPLPPHQINADVPPAISHLILRLMAKAAEERYQSAWGVKADLEAIQVNLTNRTDLSHFTLGQHDFSDRFQLPQKLYGREDAITPLFAAFEEVTQGQSDLLLVAGYSGVGKTAVVQEIYKPMTEKRGYFIAGKFDQFQRNVPYSAVVQAFRDLVRQLLTETQVQLEAWKTQILTAVGNNAQVIIDVIPEVELILGTQPAVPVLPPTESQNRFNLVFQNFIQVFCQADHPLVIFLDDLQWVDSASLKLMTLMMSDISYLLLIGAYRNNEVNPLHPLITTVVEMQQQGLSVQTLTLTPLTLDHLDHLVSDTLHLPLAQTLPLAELVLAKTGGNPFFVGEFLKTLYVEQLLNFIFSKHEWQWDLAQIRARNITDNVVELMTGKIQRLPLPTQDILKLAASVGNQFDVATLSVISQQSCEKVKAQLWVALVEGLIVPVVEGKYKFVHDRVQQAAYSLIPEGERPALHLQIGRLWLANTVTVESSNALLEIVNQLNAGNELIESEAEQLRLAELNLVAGKRAKSSAAYETALNYFTLGISLLTENCWQSVYSLTFDLHLEQAECSYLVGHFETAEQGFDLTLSQARTHLERATLFAKKVVLHNNRLLFREALVSGKEGLASLDSPVPQEDAEVKMAIAQEMATIQARLVGVEIEALIDLPELTDPTKLKVMELCVSILPTSYGSGNFDLFTWLILKMVNLSLSFGNSRLSSHAYTTYGVTLSIFSDYNTAYRFAKLGQALGQKYPDMTILGKNDHVFGLFISHWKQSLQASLNYLIAGHLRMLEVGNFEYATYSITMYISLEIFTGKNLELVYQDIRKYSQFLEKRRNQMVIEHILPHLQCVLSLLGQTKDKYSLGDDEAVKIATAKQNNSTQTMAYYLFNKLQLHCLYGDYTVAVKFAREAEPLMVTLVGTFFQAEFCFYHALILATLYTTLENEEREKLTGYQKQLQCWAEQCPENFEHMDLLVKAQMSQHAGEEMVALKYYKQATQSARENGFTHKEALAYELVAKFWLDQGEDEYAKIHLTEAYHAYQRWGAKAKLQHLEQQYPQWLPPHRVASATATLTTATARPMTSVSGTRVATSSTGWLDLASVMKAAQALSDEMILENLLTQMMHTVIENAGAQRGVLILEQQGQWRIQAEMTVQPEKVIVLQALPPEGAMPLMLLNYVIRTKQSVVFEDLQKEPKYQEDDYVRTHHLKSVLCLVLLHQQKLVGVIYLENNLTTGVFTPARSQVLTLLSSQMAISLDNARFVQELEQARQAAEAANQAKTAFLSNVSHELRTPLNGILGYGQLLQTTQLSEEQQELVQEIYRSGEHLLVMVSDILDISRLQTARLELQVTDVYLSQLLTDSVAWFRDQAREKGLAFHYEPDHHLPTGILADAKRLRQILHHLLSNAVKFTQQGSITFQVHLLPETTPERHRLQFSVTDTGIGMSETTLAKLFTPFEQASDWLHKSAGAGLGLSLAKQLVELMGGKITVHSQVGEGTRFTVQLDFMKSQEWQGLSTQDAVAENLPETPPPRADTSEIEVALKGPPAAQAAELCNLARMGDFFEILELVTQLEQEDEELHPFVEKIRQWAENFQDEPIEKLARQFIDSV